jgi:hypothetical protein
MKTLILFLIFQDGIGIDIFELSGSARAKGMGDAFTSISDDGSAIFYNPAGISNINKFRILYMHSELAFDSYFDNISIIKNPFGISYIRLVSNDIPIVVSKDTNFYDTTNLYIERINYLSHGIYVSSGFSIKFLKIGANFKIFEERTKFFKNRDYNFDFGFFKTFEFLNLGLLLKDFDFKNNYSFLCIGLSSLIFEEILISAEFEKIFKKDIYKFRAGFEWNFSKYFKLRGGINGKDFTIGAGILSSFLEVDYAFIMHSEIPSSHRISFEFFF